VEEEEEVGSGRVWKWGGWEGGFCGERGERRGGERRV